MAKKEILVVEDQEELRKLQSLLLSSRGFRVSEAQDGKAALDCLAKSKPDLVLLDIMMPEINGFEVCQHIKSNESTRHIPVIMVTAKKDREDMERAEKAGADGYITKPFKSALLIDTIRRSLSETFKPDFSST